ncbi:hypothetical protein Sjap_019416 [Stephania japonica]|uniref:Uncharacterized protein n=1 Tax=Stephania japonica TaxID=461633 RepID=A0AAP0HY47_9MAGN
MEGSSMKSTMYALVMVLVMCGVLANTCHAAFNVNDFVQGCVITKCINENFFLGSFSQCKACANGCAQVFQPTGPLTNCLLECSKPFCDKVVTPDPSNLLKTDVIAIAKDFLPQCASKCAS